VNYGTDGRTDLFCALALDGDEEASTIALWVTQRCREVRAAHDAEFDVAVLDERETDGVLLAEEEALGAVDRIEGPHACKFIIESTDNDGDGHACTALTAFGSARVAPAVDGGEERVDRAHGGRGPDSPCGVLARSERCTKRVVYEGREAVAEGVCGGRVAAKIGRILFAWD